MGKKNNASAHLSFGSARRKIAYISLLIYILLFGGFAVLVYSHPNILFQTEPYRSPGTGELRETDDESKSQAENAEGVVSSPVSTEDNHIISPPKPSASRSPSSVPASSSSNFGSVNSTSPDSGGDGVTGESPSASVAFYADSQTDTSQEEQNHQITVDFILASGANPVFHAGDLMEDGTQASLDSFNVVTSILRSSRSFYAAQGNNERNSSLYFDNFIFPGNERWYSVNIGNLHMVVLDSAYSATSPEQLDWLISDLKSSASQSRITGIMFHHPIYPNNDKGMRASYEPVFIDNGVDFVLSGHNHSYYHSVISGIHYFVTSGQPVIGYLHADVYLDKIVFDIHDSGNSLVQTISVNER